MAAGFVIEWRQAAGISADVAMSADSISCPPPWKEHACRTRDFWIKAVGSPHERDWVDCRIHEAACSRSEPDPPQPFLLREGARHSGRRGTYGSRTAPGMVRCAGE